jgi:glutamate dehydrogenase/leucine dehydrogenase
MAENTSVKRRVGEKLLMPIVAAGTSAAVGYVAKRAPGFVEDKVWPRLQEAVQGAGGVAEKLPEQLTQRARDVTGIGGDDGETAASSGLSQDELSRRSEERASHRAKRRKATKST